MFPSKTARLLQQIFARSYPQWSFDIRTQRQAILRY